MYYITVFTTILSSLLIISGCKKDNTPIDNVPANYYMQMRIDNKDISLNDSFIAVRTSGVDPFQMFALGINVGASQIRLSNSSVGTYIDTHDFSIKRYITQFTVNVLPHNPLPYGVTFYRPDPGHVNAINLKITAVNRTYVEGNFSGVLYRYINSTDSVFTTVTDGKFRVPFSQ